MTSILYLVFTMQTSELAETLLMHAKRAQHSEFGSHTGSVGTRETLRTLR